MSAGCRIRRNFERPAKELVEAFRGIPVANIDDNCGRIAAVDASIFPLNPKARLLGTAFTVNAPAGDNLLFHKALDMAQPGDVIVLANKGSMSRALCGEIMSNYAKSRGIAGIVINPGDIIVGDSDGLLAIKPDEHTAELAEIARNYHAGEEKQLEGILTRGEWPRPWVDEALKKVGFEFVD